jgi:hypothetical protein
VRRCSLVGPYLGRVNASKTWVVGTSAIESGFASAVAVESEVGNDNGVPAVRPVSSITSIVITLGRDHLRDNELYSSSVPSFLPSFLPSKV